MAELTALPLKPQLQAIAWARWQLLCNSLRTTRGKLEAISRVWTTFWFVVLGLGGAVGFGFGGWHFVHNGEAEWLGLFLWPLFLFWQIFPLAASAFTERVDTSHLARYPLAFRAWCLVRVVFGAVDVATLVGVLCTLGLTLGVIAASPALALPMIVAALLFVAFNIVLAQMIFAWLEHWLAKRRTREILGLIFFVFIVGVNFIGPLADHWKQIAHTAESGPWQVLLPLATWLPPGLPGQSLALASAGRWAAGLGTLVALAAFTAAALWLLSLRLRAEYRGEVWSEAVPQRAAKPAVRAAAPAAAGSRRWGRLPGAARPELAVAHKELRYILRSPMMFFSLVMPIVLLVFFRVGVFNGNHGGGVKAAGYGFPIVVAYALMILMGLIFNACGSDAVGIQLYFVAPVHFRQVLAGKNIAYGALLAGETAVLYIAAYLIDRPPAAVILAATLLGLLLASLCAFAAGNLVSLYMPKKIDLSRMGRQNARGASGMIALGIEGAAIAVAVLVMLAGFALHRPWAAVVALALLAAAAALVYRILLERTTAIALSRRETMITELSKA